jgi:hypothetical protein
VCRGHEFTNNSMMFTQLHWLNPYFLVKIQGFYQNPNFISAFSGESLFFWVKSELFILKSQFIMQ